MVVAVGGPPPSHEGSFVGTVDLLDDDASRLRWAQTLRRCLESALRQLRHAA